MKYGRWIAGLTVCLLSAGLTGCEEAVDPVLGTDRAFTLYGFFNPLSDSQAVRVFPIEGLLEQTRPDPIDAIVTSVDQDTGQRFTWRDSVVTFVEGTVGHVYWAPFRAVYEHAYRIEASRSDGAVTWAEARVPPPVEAVVGEPALQVGEVVIPVDLVGEAPHLIQLQVIYFVSPVSGGNATTTVPVAVPYGGREVKIPGGWRIPVSLSRDQEEITNQLLGLRIWTGASALRRIELLVMAVNAEWSPPGGLFDPEVLVQPGTFSNVQNGFGFVGAGFPVSAAWLPDSLTQARAGFVVLPEPDSSGRTFSRPGIPPERRAYQP